MTKTTAWGLSALIILLAGCTHPTQPNLTAFQRNVGPGSTIGNTAEDGEGQPGSGNTRVPGVSTASSDGNSSR